jgi:hypothetical protein
MSQHNLDHLDCQQDDDAFPPDVYTAADEEAMHNLWLARQQQERDAACFEMAVGMSLDLPAVPCGSTGEVMARVEGGLVASVNAALSVLFA